MARSLLGAVRRTQEMPVLYMLATGDIDVDVAEASERAQAGVTHMKIKVGGKPVEQDIERTIAIRRAVNGGVQLSADCNQGWTHEEALAYVGAASESLDFLEQPIMGYDVEGMAMIAAASACPIGADEGLHSVGDVHKHNDMGAAKGGSLKMIKLGGVTRAYQAAELFDELGMHVNMAGKVAESSVSSAAVLQLAAAAPSIEWGVSVTCQYLKEDVCKDSLRRCERSGDSSDRCGPGCRGRRRRLVEIRQELGERHAKPSVRGESRGVIGDEGPQRARWMAGDVVGRGCDVGIGTVGRETDHLDLMLDQP